MKSARRFTYGSHKLLKSNLSVDGGVVKGSVLPNAICALLIGASEQRMEWNNLACLPKVIKRGEFEGSNGGLEMGAGGYLHLHLGSGVGIEPVSEHARCIPLSPRLKIIVRRCPNENAKEGFQVMAIEMDWLGFVIVDKFQSHEG